MTLLGPAPMDKNLKIVASNLEAWTSENGKPYDDLKNCRSYLEASAPYLSRVEHHWWGQ